MPKQILKEVILEWSKLRWFFFAGAMFYFSFVSVLSDNTHYVTLYSVKAMVVLLFFLFFPIRTNRAPLFSYLPLKNITREKNEAQRYICAHALFFSLLLFVITLLMELGVAFVKCFVLHRSYVMAAFGTTGIAVLCYLLFLCWLTLGWWHSRIRGSYYVKKKRGKAGFISSILFIMLVFALFDANAMLTVKGNTLSVLLLYGAAVCALLLLLYQIRTLIYSLFYN